MRHEEARPARSLPAALARAWASLAFVAFLYSQPLRSYFSTRDTLGQRTEEVRQLRAQKLRLERRLADVGHARRH